MRQTRRRAGLTLVEIVIALAVLAIALTGVMAAITASMTASSLNRQTNMARDAAMKKLDEVRSRDYTTLLVSYDVPGTAPTPATYASLLTSFTVPGLDTGTGYVWLDPAGSDNAIMNVHVVILWSSEKGQREYKASAVITR